MQEGRGQNRIAVKANQFMLRFLALNVRDRTQLSQPPKLLRAEEFAPGARHCVTR